MSNLYWILLTCALSSCFCLDRAGIRVAVTKKGFGTIADLIPIIERDASKFPIPDIGPYHLKENFILVDIVLDIWLKNIKINKLAIPEFSIQPSAKSGFELDTKLSMSLQFDLSMKGWLDIIIPIFAEPKTYVDVENFDVSLSFKIIRNSVGNLELDNSSLKSAISIGKLDIRFDGGLNPEAWLLNVLNLFKSLSKKIVASEIEEMLPTILPKVISSINLQLQLNMSNYFNVIDLHLVDNPIFDDNYFSLLCNGTIRLKRNKPTYPAPPPLLPPLPQNLDNMLYLWLSNFTINSAIWSYYIVDTFNVTISPSNLTASSNFSKFIPMLNTKFYKLFIPKLYAEYPDKNLTLYISAFSTPNISFYQDEMGISLNLTWDIRVNDSNRFVPILKLGTAFNIKSSLNISNSQGAYFLELKAVSLHHNLLLLQSDPILGDVDKLMQLINRILYDQFFINLINSFLPAKGFDISPLLDQFPVEILSPDLRFSDGFLLIDMSFKFKQIPFLKRPTPNSEILRKMFANSYKLSIKREL